ncbi:phage tail protein [Neisseria sicca]|uniref:phage tail protein n=1 Tax=Neisseria sicca TaxID=490 RepID=UPI003F9F49D3
MGGKSSTITSAEERILSLQVQRSSQGLTLPVIYGRTRVAGNLIWYGDFITIEHKTTTQQGGKGGGGVTQEDIKYTYEAAVMLALCEGEISGVGRIWRDKEKFDSLAQLRLTLMRGGDEQPLWTHLAQAKHTDQALNYSGTAYLCSPNYELTKSAQIYQHNFEVIGKLGYSGSIPDANPRDIIRDLLTNQRYGCGFPAESIGDTDRYSNYCRAVGIFLSPAYTEQGEAQRNISELLEQTNSAAVFSQGRLKIIPYGDGNYRGNGAAYIADNKAIYDLTDDDFIVSGAEDPVNVERKTNADAFNQIQVEYLDRNNDYNVAVAEVKDQANIEQYGLRPKEAVKMQGICNGKVAQKVAQQLLQRALYVRNEYEFKLGWKYCLLEPMDIVTLTDAGLGLDKTPVRITEIEEDEEGVLSVKAEDYPVGVYTTSEYPTQPSLGYSADYNVSPGNAHAPVIFEAPLQLTGGEPQIWMATAGGDMWGGAEVWVSTDGDSYTRVGAVNHKARFGSLTAALPSGAVFDRTNTLNVEISAGQITGGTEQDSRDLLTLCYVDGEFLAYANAELKGVGRYTLGNLTRGAYGSAIDTHAAGSQFARIDETLFKYPVPRNWIGRTVWVKLVSYNVFSGGIQDLASVPAYSYTIKGAPLGQIQNLRLSSSWAYGKEAVVVWDKLDGADTYDVEIYAGNSQRRLRAISGIVDNSYTYTQADMKADGGQVRDVVFKVRGRAVTGKTGAWAQIAAQNPQLQALQGISVDSGLKQAFFTCQKPAEEDFAGIIVWVSENAAVPTIDANKVYDGAETFVTIAKCNGNPLEKGKTYHLRAAGYDSFGKDALKISNSVSFTVYDVNTTDLSESNLNRALRDKIDLIDGNGTGSVNERIKNAKEDSKREVQTLSSRLDSFEVGGRNYALSTGNDAKVLRVGGANQTKSVNIDVSPSLELKQGDKLIISCDIEMANATSIHAKPYPRIGAEFSVTYADNSVGYFGAWYDEAVSGTTKTLKQRLVAKHTVAKEVKSIRGIVVQARYQTSDAIKVSGVKLERGTVATDWTPAPEDNDVLQEISGTVQVVQNTLAKATGDIKSLGERITTAQSTADGNKATVQAHSRSINGLEAQYTVKVDVNGKVAGYGLATTPKNGTPESKFIVNADRFGIGAPGKEDAFPFVVDTQQNRVGVNGELVVNGKAIIDRLNVGDIDGNKIRVNSIGASRIIAGSIDSREIRAAGINADRLNVNHLSAISSDLGDIRGGNLNIGNGNFTVTPEGILTANNAVIRGRIEAESGYFNGTMKASHIEGDVFRVRTMTRVGNVWRAEFESEGVPMMWHIAGTALSLDTLGVKLRLNGANIVLNYHSIVNKHSLIRNNELSAAPNIFKAFTFGWYAAAIRGSNLVEVQIERGNFQEEYPILQTAYLTNNDPLFRQLSQTKRWRRYKDNHIQDGGSWESLPLPQNILGIRFNAIHSHDTGLPFAYKMLHSSGIDDIGIAGRGNVNTFLSREWQTPLVSPVLKFYTNNKYVVLQNIDILEYV